MKRLFVPIVAAVLMASGCRKEAATEPVPVPDNGYFTLEDVSRLLGSVPIGREQVGEVHDAVTASAGNGYDDEYLMRDVFASPGAGIGSSGESKAGNRYARPLRDLLREAVTLTKAGGGNEDFLDALAESDVQIYWPFSDSWDGQQMPVITFDPGDFSETNWGYTPSGEKVLVDEQMASERPVWVVSRNADSEYTSLEMLRRQDPSWGHGGGDILVGTKAGDSMKTLILRSFKANRQYDSWFAGASEFFVKVGSVEDFTASTEPELRVYQPFVTDFMIVVRRSQIKEIQPFNAILISEWTDGLQNCALMILEDDGGTRTSWKTSATVKYNSKVYGVEIDIPMNQRDDIVWRGSLTRGFIEKNSGKTVRLGDVELVLELI